MKRLFFIVYLLLFVVPSSLAEEVKVYVVTANQLNLRKKAKTGEVLSHVFKGDTVYVETEERIADGDKWCWVMWAPKNNTVKEGKRPHGWANAKYLKDITDEYSQNALMSRFYPSLYKARKHLLWTIIAFVVVIVLFFLAMLLEDEIGADWTFRLFGFLLHVTPIALPGLLCQYLYLNPDESFWFMFKVPDYGWIGFIVWVIISVLAAILAVNGLKFFFTNWSEPLFTLCYAAGAGCWGYYFYLGIPQFWEQAPGGFLFMLFIMVAFALPGGCGGASMPTSGSLHDGYGRTAATGHFSGENFYDTNGTRYNRQTDGSWKKC